MVVHPIETTYQPIRPAHYQYGNLIRDANQDSNKSAVSRFGRTFCKFPIALSLDTQKQVWVACFASAELVAIDQDSFALRRRISLNDQPLKLLAHPTLSLAYVSLPKENAIAEIDLESGNELRRLGVGIEPDGLRWATAECVM